MSEEFVTLRLMEWLKSHNWEILSFDFPQSGTGVSMHPEGTLSKNMGTIIPDIVSRSPDGNKGLFFENKNRFYVKDFQKIDSMRTTDTYRKALISIYGGVLPNDMKYGIGIPNFPTEVAKALKSKSFIDFLTLVDERGHVEISLGEINL